jgi:hypothetical protein
MAAFAGVNSDGNPRIYGGKRKVQLIIFTYLTKIQLNVAPIADIWQGVADRSRAKLGLKRVPGQW